MEIKKLLATLIIAGISFTILSITIISPLAPLGTVLIPGSGIWRAPGEVPEAETVYIDTLSDKVTVYRDEWGIPHIYAEGEEDLSFAMGYLHAQDRFFQMDMARRDARGLLSEVLGPTVREENDMLNSDKLNRAIGLEYWANKSLEKAKELEEKGEIDILDSLEAYVDGVNYYVNTHTQEWPIEYSILGFKPTDRPWTTLDTMVFLSYMVKMMTWTYWDLERLITFDALNNQEDFHQLFNPSVSPYQIPICPNYGEYEESSVLYGVVEPPKVSSKLLTTISNFLDGVRSIPSERVNIEALKTNSIGSNNWVIDGDKSNTGKPILCNDQHLAWSSPGIWYEGHSVFNGENIYGLTIPGIPLPIVGHNEHVAWGATNTRYDVLDFFYFNEKDSDHYIYQGMVKEYEKRNYAIPLKGGGIEDFTVKVTEHGPVLNDFLEAESMIPNELEGDKIVITSKWIANELNLAFRAIYGFFYAQNRADFDQASEYFYAPAQNFVYADVDGNIGIRPTGRVPIRAGNLDGAFPCNGSDASGIGDWIDYIDFEDLPHTENPEQGYLTSANQIAVGPEYTKYPLQHPNPNSPGYRARRINEVLSNAEDGTVGIEEMKELQLDTLSIAARYFTTYCINAVEEITESERTTIMNDALTKLKKWNFDMDKDVAGPAIYRKFLDYFMENTFQDDFKGTELETLEIYPQPTVLEKLMREEPNSKWFDDKTTTDREDRDDIIVKSYIDALDFLEDFYGTDDVGSWRWGDLHELGFPHILEQDTLGKGPYEGDGGQHTVNVAPVNIKDGSGVANYGASSRLIFDLGNLSNSYSCLPSGQRGHSNSKHYSDQLEQLFLQGKYHKQYFYDKTEDFPEDNIESSITLLPGEQNDLKPSIIAICLIPAIIIGNAFVFTKMRKKSLNKPEIEASNDKEVLT